MARVVHIVETNAVLAKALEELLREQGRNPETYLRTENVEGVRISIFILMCDAPKVCKNVA